MTITGPELIGVTITLLVFYGFWTIVALRQIKKRKR